MSVDSTVSMSAGSTRPETYDVAIIGGGPSGATVGALLAKYKPDLRVLILEREISQGSHWRKSLASRFAGLV